MRSHNVGTQFIASAGIRREFTGYLIAYQMINIHE